jgi:hypothetical protein
MRLPAMATCFYSFAMIDKSQAKPFNIPKMQLRRALYKFVNRTVPVAMNEFL